jgi:CspA family cold shock protein
MWTIAWGIVLGVLLLIGGLIALILIVYFLRSGFGQLADTVANRNAEQLIRKRIQSLASEARERGTVKWFDASGDYGVIRRQTGEDVSVHFSAILMAGFKLLSEGQVVEFEVKDGPKGLQAENVLPL